MVNVDKAILARYDHSGIHFEILVDCDKALDYKEGKIDNLDDVLATNDIFKDVKKAEHSPEAELLKVFQTTDRKEIASRIIKKGEIQLTTEHKAKLREEKKKQIVAFIHRNAIDSKTGHPHPPQRIELALEQAKIRVDEFKPISEQVQEAITKLRPIIPIKIEKRELSIQIPADFTGKVYNSIRKYGKLMREDWLSTGALSVILEIPAGIQEELENELNKLTRGEAEFRILSKK
jgi:ribosome maturation protein SDO1